MRYSSFVIILFSLFFSSCYNQVEEIVELDIKSYLKLPELSIKVGDQNANLQLLFEDLYKSTINKKIPNIPIYSLSGDTIEMYHVLMRKSILIFSDTYCAYGMDGLNKDFPKAYDQVTKDFPEESIEVICFIIRTYESEDEPKRIETVIKEVKEQYMSIYIIDQIMADRLNIFGNPTRYYINDSKILTHLGMGSNQIKDYQYNEIVDYYILNKEMKKLRSSPNQP